MMQNTPLPPLRGHPATPRASRLQRIKAEADARFVFYANIPLEVDWSGFMPVFLRCIFISLGIHALLVWLWSYIPTPVRDPFRFLRHTPSPIIMEVDRPSVVVAWHA